MQYWFKQAGVLEQIGIGPMPLCAQELVAVDERGARDERALLTSYMHDLLAVLLLDQREEQLQEVATLLGMRPFLLFTERLKRSFQILVGLGGPHHSAHSSLCLVLQCSSMHVYNLLPHGQAEIASTPKASAMQRKEL